MNEGLVEGILIAYLDQIQKERNHETTTTGLERLKVKLKQIKKDEWS